MAAGAGAVDVDVDDDDVDDCLGLLRKKTKWVFQSEFRPTR